jgi:hemerythrin superfamily protein
MTIYECLRKDHRKVETLLNRLVKATKEDADGWQEIVEQIRDDLIPHARAEESVFYNAIRQLDPGNELVRHSYTEHLKAETELRALLAMKAIDVNWSDLARRLRKDLLHHVEEEEGKVFPAAKKLFSQDEAIGIGAAFERLKASIREQSSVVSTLGLVANLLPPRLVEGFRKGRDRAA